MRKLKHGTFISVWNIDLPDVFNAFVGNESDRLSKEVFERLLSEGSIKLVGKEPNYDIYLTIDKDEIETETVLKQELIDELAEHEYYYIPGEHDDANGLTFTTTYGATIRFLTHLCDQGIDVTVSFEVAGNDDHFMVGTDLLETTLKITKYLNKKLVQ